MSIPTIQKAENGHFYAHWSEGKRSKRQSLGTKDPDEAERRFARWLTIRHAAPEDGAGVFTLADLWDHYTKGHLDREASDSQTPQYSWRMLKPHFGALTLSLLSQDDVDGYVLRRTEFDSPEVRKLGGPIGTKPVRPSTVRRELGALIACMNWCADPRRKPQLIAQVHVPLLKMPPESAPRDRWLRRNEIDQLLTAAAEKRGDGRMSRVERFLWLALETAKREGAILDLTWDRIDFETGMIDFDVPGRKLTKKRRGAVPISNRLREPLLRMWAERLDKKDNPTGLVLDHKATLWASVQSAVIDAGLAERERPSGPTKRKPKATGISPHTLRHTAATHMARRGVPLYTIAGVLGNTLAMVEKVYAKHCPTALRSAVNAISGDEIRGV